MSEKTVVSVIAELRAKVPKSFALAKDVAAFLDEIEELDCVDHEKIISATIDAINEVNNPVFERDGVTEPDEMPGAVKQLGVEIEVLETLIEEFPHEISRILDDTPDARLRPVLERLVERLQTERPESSDELRRACDISRFAA